MDEYKTSQSRKGENMRTAQKGEISGLTGVKKAEMTQTEADIKTYKMRTNSHQERG